jgi:hypothetical protein
MSYLLWSQFILAKARLALGSNSSADSSVDWRALHVPVSGHVRNVPAKTAYLDMAG